ncbi:MAG: hypothetical protein WC679_12345 [Bacteroidales bacterium]|jgi:hypothetical protein
MAEENRDDSKAPFNMAIDTLRRIGKILDEMAMVAADGLLSPAQKQFILVPKLQYFFFQASPLLKPEIVDKFKDQVIRLRPNQTEVSITKGGITKKREIRLLYDPVLNDELNRLLIDIQRELQIEKYFMPPKKDLSRAITEM